MFDYLEKLRAKPEKTRKKIVLGMTCAIVGVIFLFWIVATVWRIEHPTASVGGETITGDLSDLVHKAESSVPAISF